MVRWHHHLNGMNLSKLQEIAQDRGARHAAVQSQKELDTIW